MRPTTLVCISGAALSLVTACSSSSSTAKPPTEAGRSSTAVEGAPSSEAAPGVSPQATKAAALTTSVCQLPSVVAVNQSLYPKDSARADLDTALTAAQLASENSLLSPTVQVTSGITCGVISSDPTIAAGGGETPLKISTESAPISAANSAQLTNVVAVAHGTPVSGLGDWAWVGDGLDGTSVLFQQGHYLVEVSSSEDKATVEAAARKILPAISAG